MSVRRTYQFTVTCNVGHTMNFDFSTPESAGAAVAEWLNPPGTSISHHHFASTDLYLAAYKAGLLKDDNDDRP